MIQGLVLQTATEQIMDIRQTLRYFEAPIGSKSYLFDDNRSVITRATLPHSTLTKCHNILAFHIVREAIAAKIMAFYWIQSAYNLSDMLSKHWDHPSVYPMILKPLITRGNITHIPKEATQEKEKENDMTENKENKKKEIQKNIKIENGNCRKKLSCQIVILFYVCISPSSISAMCILSGSGFGILFTSITCPTGSQMLASILCSKFPSKCDLSLT